jgi:23S rRNA pseudouridine2457 synthase
MAMTSMYPGGHRYFIVNKPYDMVSQFISPHDVRLLSHLDFDFPPGTHAVGRLDQASEGLLILTTNKRVTKLLFESEIPHRRAYAVQVSQNITTSHLDALRSGVSIKIKSGNDYTTQPCSVAIINDPGPYCILEDRISAYPPYTWILISLEEGKYHQIRKMITAIGQKCKRLVRVSIEQLKLGNLSPEVYWRSLNLNFSKSLISIKSKLPSGIFI